MDCFVLVGVVHISGGVFILLLSVFIGLVVGLSVGSAVGLADGSAVGVVVCLNVVVAVGSVGWVLR